ncbi:MAG: hypothetical protein EA397_01500 [Deltaproteobacteria bacterium]|nr:MAG: hypothetical protein EA397_01500 [Deltaproteobacteria bacterium]
MQWFRPIASLLVAFGAVLAQAAEPGVPDPPPSDDVTTEPEVESGSDAEPEANPNEGVGVGAAEPSESEPVELPVVPPVKKKERKIGVTFNEDLEVRWWRRPERLPDFPERAVFNYVEQVNRFSAFFTGGSRWTGWAQLDQVALFFNRYKLDGQIYHERELLQPDMRSITPGFSYINLEKVAVSYKGDDLEVTLGDFYAAFGRGGALNLNRNTDIDIDTSIQGMKAVYRPGDWSVTGLFGQLNRQQVFQDNPNILIGPDRRHAIAGLSIERYGVGPANVALHGVALDYVNQGGWEAGFRELGTTPDVLVGGATVEMDTGPIEWAGEVDFYGFPTAEAWGGGEPCGGDPNCFGFAGYLSSTIYAGAASVLVEGKRYKDTQRINGPLTSELYQVAILPTLEYEMAITEDSAATLNSNDVWAGLVRVDVQASDAFMPYLSLMVARDEDLGVLHFNRVPETIIHPLTGVELIAGDSSVMANAGWRTDLRDGTQWGFDRQIHADVQAKMPLFGDYYFAPQVNFEHFKWGVNIGPGESPELQQTDYIELESSLSFMKGSQLAVTWFTDYTTNPLVNDIGNLGRDWFGALEVQFKPTPAWTIRVFYGAYKSGIRCAGGQCRQLPGFNGARIAATGAF